MKTHMITVLALAITLGMPVWLSSPSPANASLIASTTGMDTDTHSDSDLEETESYEAENPLEEDAMEADKRSCLGA
jgi:hypothetical protein